MTTRSENDGVLRPETESPVYPTGTAPGQFTLLARTLNRARKITTLSAIWFAVGMLLVFFSATSPHFLTLYNLTNILLQSSTIGFLGIGMTFVIITGNIDLSVGSLLALTAVLSVGLQSIGLVPALLVASVVGAALGLVNGLIIVNTGVSSFVVTLAAMIGFKGLAFMYTKEQSLTASDSGFTALGLLSLGGIPLIGLFYLLLTGLAHWILVGTVHGRNSLAIGGNATAARNAGINAKWTIVVNYTFMGLLSAVSGIALSMQMGSATPVLGEKYELWAIAATVLGGASLYGGSGSVIGTLGGTLVIGILLDGFNLLNVAPFYVYILLGVVLIGALVIDRRS
jgi:ribose transport system permease protein